MTTTRWAPLFIVRAFFNDTITVAFWAGFHVRLMGMLPHPPDIIRCCFAAFSSRCAHALYSVFHVNIADAFTGHSQRRLRLGLLWVVSGHDAVKIAMSTLIPKQNASGSSNWERTIPLS